MAEKVMSKWLTLASCVLLAGCVTIVAQTPKSIAVTGADPTTVTSVAQAHCAQYGKVAEVHEITSGGWTTIFNCVESE